MKTKTTTTKKATKKLSKSIKMKVPAAATKIHLVKSAGNPFRGECRRQQFARLRNGMTVEAFKANLIKAKLGFDNRLLAMAASKGAIRLSA